MKAMIVGGGLGGIAAAVALRKIGWQVSVFERASEFGEVGAGVGVMPNALRALDELGVGAEVRLLGTPQGTGGVRTWHGRWLVRLPNTGDQRVVAIHRADLHRALLSALPPECLHTSAEVTDVDSLEADLVVAADGINSGIRALLWPNAPAPVSAGVTAWRGVTARTFPGLEISQTLGRGREFGILPLGDGRVCWYAAAVTSITAAGGVREVFDGCHDPIPDLLAATPAEAVLRHDIHELATPLPSYVSGRVALLGDAAHAMTPYLGQGACQAIEDAVVLAAACASEPGVKLALARYDAQRRPRTKAISRAARTMGTFGVELRDPIGVALRDAVLRFTPPRLAMRAMTRFSSWLPPALNQRVTGGNFPDPPAVLK
ncbi:MAG: FAD-dependent monooxygenase [Kutzneria sp.]|nr:FAD-dependent monooxygenase [Kutzneria sp.]